MDLLKEFYGPNAGYVLELYERYQNDPNSVDAETRRQFKQWTPRAETVPAVTPGQPVQVSRVDPQKIAGAVNLANAIRTYGLQAARLDPLGSPPPSDPWLDPAAHGVKEDDLRQLPADIVGGPVCGAASNAWEAIQSLREIYAKTVGYEYGHIRIPEERQWLREAAECGRFRPPDDPIDAVALLEQLTRVEALEHYLHRTYPGKTRFSIEGLDMMVPMLDDLLGCAADDEVCTMIIGMAHRGRLNVLAHILGKPYAQILAEFKDPVKNFPTRDEMGWTGDVKYHKGGQRALRSGDGKEGGRDNQSIRMIIGMPPNPSHLEHIDPVVVGMARAAGSKVDDPGPPEFFTNASLPVLIHGDAAFSGQGVVAETLNFSRLAGYWTGGTLHIISNNQLGYTATPAESRSTQHASDLAKGFQIPIIHVNADDPVACIEAIRTAYAYRQKFKKDFLIDLIGYRRYGHNEGDEPSFTQPLMYARIEKHPSVRALWAQQMVENGLVEPDLPEEMLKERMNELQQVSASLEPSKEVVEPVLEPPPSGAARQVKTAVSMDTLRLMNENLLKTPQSFHLNRKLERGMKRRRSAFDDPDQATIDWATAEELAFASILADGIPIRLTGEDVERGTFSQRHAVFHDVENGDTFTPLQALPQAKASFEVLNSALSENAAIGFEFGYNIQAPGRLVIWEAQYGDFINAAQAMIDEFIISARAKWEQTPSLVLLLPHGYEGQGPDHSSGRPERFLQLAADLNLRLANCTTAAQYFHLLRRQALLLTTDPLPLIVMTPKSLLRNPLVASPPSALAGGSWQPVLDDKEIDEGQVRRLVLCSGKVYVDLVTAEQRKESNETALVRVEQLYPFPTGELSEALDRYPGLEEVRWVQEEPANMGAWEFVRPRLLDLIDGRWPLRFIGRSDSASPAEGSSAWHTIYQKKIVSQAYDPQYERVEEG